MAEQKNKKINIPNNSQNKVSNSSSNKTSNSLDTTSNTNKKFNAQKSKNYNKKKFYNNKNKNRPPAKSIEEYERTYIERKMKDGIEKPTCPVCGESIYVVEQGILHNATGSLAHFDCILKLLEGEHTLEVEEKIVYLGSGTFGIVQERQVNRSTRFFVRKRINYEDRKTKRIYDDIDTEEEELFHV